MARALPILGLVAGTIANIYAPGSGVYIYAATGVISGIVNAQEQRRLQRKAIEASRRDNLTMVRSAEEFHRVCYGRARVSGPVAFAHSTGAENGNLYIIVCLAGHEFDAIEEIVFNETKLGVTSGDVLFGSSFFAATLIRHLPALVPVIDGSGGQADPTPIYNLDANLKVTLPVTGNFAYVTHVWSRYNESPFTGFANLAFTNDGPIITVTEPGVTAGFQVYIDWAEWQGQPLVDVASYLGTSTQAADANLMGASGGKWTSAHQLKGRPYIRARLIWNQDRFLAGVPNISARVRGRKVLDPRSPTDGFNWSNNSALCIRDYLTNAQFGLACTSAELDDTSFIDASNVCDELIVVDVTTIADLAVRAKWAALLHQAAIDGTWEETNAETVNDFGSLTGLTLRNAGSMSIDSTTFPGDSALSVNSQSGSFSTYVQLDYAGSIANGSIRLTVRYPGITQGVGMAVRVANRGSADVFDGYRAQISGTTNQVLLLKFTGASHITLGGPISISPPGGNSTCTLELSFDGNNRLQLFYQGVRYIDVTDVAAPYTTGGIDLVAFTNPPTIPNLFLDATLTDPSVAIFQQRRYTCNGVFTVDRTPEDVLSALLSSCAGQLSYTGGVFRLVVGSYQTPTLTLTQDDLRGPISILPKKPRRELFNAVRGIYAGKGTFDQPTDFPPVTNPTYETQDGGEQISTDLQFEFTNDGTAAQRIAKIHLEKERQGIVFNAPCTLKAISLRPGDTVMWTLPRMGWTSKVFRVEDWSFRCDEDFGIDLVLQEEAAANYDWNLGDATVVDPAPDTTLGLSLPQGASEVAIAIMHQEDIPEEELIL